MQINVLFSGARSDGIHDRNKYLKRDLIVSFQSLFAQRERNIIRILCSEIIFQSLSVGELLKRIYSYRNQSTAWLSCLGNLITTCIVAHVFQISLQGSDSQAVEVHVHIRNTVLYYQFDVVVDGIVAHGHIHFVDLYHLTC